MTLDLVESNTINGQAVSDVPRFMSVAGPFDEWLAADVKRSEKQKESANANVESAVASSSSGPSDLGPSDLNDKVHDSDDDDEPDEDMDRIRRTLSHQSTAFRNRRNTGRDSDLMYADILNSIK